MVKDLESKIKELVDGSDCEWFLLARSKSENYAISVGSCTSQQLFSMLVQSAMDDPAVKRSIEATALFFKNQLERNLMKENPGIPVP